jgi:hypothetical protein
MAKVRSRNGGCRDPARGAPGLKRRLSNAVR